MINFNPSKSVYKDMYVFEKKYWWYLGLRDLLKYYISKSKSEVVLDAGCGTGANMIEIKSIVNKVYGVDISPEAIKFAKSKNLNNLYLSNLTDLPFDNSFFDLIYCMDVFGNLDQNQTRKTLGEFNRCLKVGGLIIIQTAGLEWLNSSHDKYWDIQKRYSIEELEKIVTECNFKLVKSTYRYFFLFPVIMIVKLINKSKKVETGDFQKLPFLLNHLLFLVMKMENSLIKLINFPIGSSIFIIAKKNSNL